MCCSIIYSFNSPDNMILFSGNTVSGEVYTWGWKECVPSGKIIGDQPTGEGLEREILERQSGTMSEQGNR